MYNSNDVLIKVENVSKKFCRSLKRSMLYGIEDISRDLLYLSNNSDKLRKDEFWAVDDVSFEVRRGECLGIIGRNGAGKSTLLKMLNGIILPDKGKITIKGKVGALIEVGAGFHPMLTGRENVYVNGSILGMTKREIDSKFDEIVAFAELEEFIDMPVKHYSSGMYVRLGFAVAVQMEPDVLILDEVLAVGDAIFRFRCMERINSLQESGVTIIFVSHDIKIMRNICDSGLLLRDGLSGETQSIGDAILSYEALLRGTRVGIGGKEYSSEARRSGKQQALMIKSFQLYNSNQIKSRQFKVGDEMELEVIIEAIKDISYPGVSFNIENAVGSRIVGWSSQYDETMYPMKSGQLLGYRFKFINILQPSAYKISIAANLTLNHHALDAAIAEDQIDCAIVFESSSSAENPVWTQVYNPVKTCIFNPL
jgi:ABC-type polysaccharide/polyol phosphate transport system ATPase subunit